MPSADLLARGDEVGTARLKLREDAYRAASPTGAAILTRRGTVTLTGASIAQWLDRLEPFLDGRHTLAQLTASLPPERGRRVEEIVAALLERSVIRTVGIDGRGAWGAWGAWGGWGGWARRAALDGLPRLYEVPHRLGYQPRPLTPEELQQHPFP